MNTTAIPPKASGGRAAAKLAVSLKGDIGSGRLVAGQFLPTERELAVQHGIGRMTVRRALKSLESTGLIAAEPRHGYRVLARNNRPEQGCPLGYVLEGFSGADSWDHFHKALMASFQEAATGRGGSLLSVGTRGQSPARVFEQMMTLKPWGAVFDAVNPEFQALALRNGLPAAMVDAWSPDALIDAVVQDDYQGGMLAAAYLISRGHREIAWFGPVAANSHSLARYAGAVAALANAGLKFAPEVRVEDEAESPAVAVKMLSRAARPTGVLSLWSNLSHILARGVRDSGLSIGRDIELVGWSPEELYNITFRPGFPEGQVPAAVVWSMSDMAETALNRLAERRMNPGLPPMKICVPVRLRRPVNSEK